MIAFINTFHVAPRDQQRVVDKLGEVTRTLVNGAPGFHSAVLHRSTDGTKVTMVARWTSLAAYEAMRRDPAPGAALAELATLARFEAGQYEIVEEFAPPGDRGAAGAPGPGVARTAPGR